MTESDSKGLPTKDVEKATARERGLFAYIPIPCFVIFLLGLLSAAVHLASCFSVRFADAISDTAGALLRFLLAKATDFLPFSFAETVLFSMPVILALFIFFGVRSARERRQFIRFLSIVLAVLFVLYTLFVFTIGCAYRGTALDKRMGIVRTKVEFSELYSTAEYVLAKANEMAASIPQSNPNGETVMGHGIAEMNDLLLQGYSRVCAEYPFIRNFSSHVKPVAASYLMSHTLITGVYSYMTGEANINVYFPDYTIPYTAAHELAHQRGVAREDEANFVAYLVCIASDDPYVRYSGYLNMLQHLGNAVYRADPKAYTELMKGCSPTVRSELVAYSEFYDQFRDSVVGEISGAVNDAYLQLQGTPGTRSYGMVVDLAVAYYRNRI